MFDIGFTELLLVGPVALMVLGPERLPPRCGPPGFVGRLKRSFSNIKAEVEREIGADEIRRQLHNERILDRAGDEAEHHAAAASNPTATPPSPPARAQASPRMPRAAVPAIR